MIYRASACGKIILLGEHAVVYGFPAVAIPVAGLRARVELIPGDARFFLEAPDVGLASALEDLPADHPLAFCVRRAADFLGILVPKARLSIASDIPVASGLGSGAAVSTAIVRALSAAAGRDLPPADVSRIVFDVERIYHGTPSGIDNTVIAFERPIYFLRDRAPAMLRIGAGLQLLLADSGVRSETRLAVGGVRERWRADPARYDDLFRSIGALADTGREHLESGRVRELGATMNQCHKLLQAIGVSTPELDGLVGAAREAGALGAKLTGAGRGGNMAALVDAQSINTVESALRRGGAAAVYRTILESD